MNSFKKIIFQALFSVVLVSTSSAQELPAESLKLLVDQAVANHHEITMAQARQKMFENRAKGVGQWEDPMLMLKIQNAKIKKPLDFDDDPMTQKVIGISQLIPFAGKTSAKEDVARLEAESYRWQADERKLEVARMVKEMYYSIWFTDKATDTIERNIKILDDFVKLAETRYAVGQGAQQDILKAQVERSKMLEMKINLIQQRKTQVAQLNALVHRPVNTPVGKIPDEAVSHQETPAAELAGAASETRPIIKAINRIIDKARASEKLARLDAYPDFNVSFEYMQRDRINSMERGDDMYALGVTFNLPLRKGRREAMAAEARSEAAMAAAELEGVRHTIEQNIADLQAQLERRAKLVELYEKGLIPQAQQSLESAVIAYRVGKIDFLSLLDSRMALYNYEREYYDSIAEYHMKKAQLESVVGREI